MEFETLEEKIEYMLGEQFEELTSDEDSEDAIEDIAAFYVELNRLRNYIDGLQKEIATFVPEAVEASKAL